MTPKPPAGPVGRRPLSLRGGLLRLSSGLIAYGLVGLTVAIVGAVAFVWVGGRVGGLADRTSGQVESIVATLDQTATVLADAGTSASSFAVTLERTPPAVRQTAATIATLRTDLLLVEGQLSAISILGSKPLGNVASLFGRMASNLDGLDGRLETIASDLEGNRGAVLANSGSLRAFGVEIGGLGDDLRGGIIEESFADVQLILTALFVLLVVWTAIPAAGALGLGVWIRRELRDPDGDGVIAR